MQKIASILSNREVNHTHVLDSMPNMEQIQVKESFSSRYKSILGDRYGEFMNYSLSWLRKSIRVNTLKISVEDLKKRIKSPWSLTPVPWCKEGFWIKHPERLDIGNMFEHQVGYYYVQGVASMIPPLVLDPKPGDSVLDMCASPGSKTSQMAQYMENKGVIVANDISGKRLSPLGINLQRCGVMNTALTIADSRKIKGFQFDKILLDAPCSGTGTIRKSLKTLNMWNPGMVTNLSSQQKGMLSSGFENLKPGGTMVYSTCSLEPEENEAVVSWFLNKQDNVSIEPITLKINRSEAITSFNGIEYDKRVKKCLRLWPMDNDTEGFFIAKFKKLK